MKKNISVDGKEYSVRELTYLEGLEIEETRQDKGLKESISKMLQLATGLSDEEVNKLSISEGKAIQLAINDVNGLDDFQEPVA